MNRATIPLAIRSSAKIPIVNSCKRESVQTRLGDGTVSLRHSPALCSALDEIYWHMQARQSLCNLTYSWEDA